MDDRAAVQFYPVSGYSMRPLIREGDVVKVRMGPGEFKRADVILYRANAGTCCHRVVRRVEEPSPGYHIQCDPFPGKLAFVGADDVIGKAVAFGRGAKFSSLERGRYRLLGESLIFIGLYMRWLPDLLRVTKRIVCDINDLRLDAISYAANFSKAQRCRGRGRFPQEKLSCDPIKVDDRATYQRFLSRHTRTSRKGVDTEYFPNLIRTVGAEHLYHVARFEQEIIGSVRMHRACTADGMHFWFVSEVYVLREFRGKGIGEKLIRSIITRVNSGDDVLYLTVNRRYFKAANLYKKIGFHEEEGLRNIVVRELYNSADMSRALFLFKRAA